MVNLSSLGIYLSTLVSLRLNLRWYINVKKHIEKSFVQVCWNLWFFYWQNLPKLLSQSLALLIQSFFSLYKSIQLPFYKSQVLFSELDIIQHKTLSVKELIEHWKLLDDLGCRSFLWVFFLILLLLIFLEVFYALILLFQTLIVFGQYLLRRNAFKWLL